jgi:hypothetical protein
VLQPGGRGLLTPHRVRLVNIRPQPAGKRRGDLNMSIKTRIAVATGAALLLAAIVASPTLAKKAPPPSPPPPTPSGNINLRVEGYEITTATGTAARISLDGIGQLLSDTAGSLNGVETFTAVDPSGVNAEEVCTGSVSGQITAPSGGFASGNGEFTISLSYAPTSGAGTFCVATTASLLCNRTLAHPAYIDDLDAGEYHCVVTNLSGSGISAASMNVHLGSVEGTNGPTN